ncbi:Kinetochore protein Spc25 [Nosema granulosis]|uniref:Kinetochore protein SPC25 n=1 Tax=Nosema granulosis TaxID=83296 RepID=A0A9P6GYN8_9MICR|nr:Kinetochore protein Spc25 [Nosema granulosis]
MSENSKNIENIIQGTIADLNEQKEYVEKSIRELKRRIKKEQFDSETQRDRLEREVAKQRELNSKLIEERNSINLLIEEDDEAIKTLESECASLREQTEKNEIMLSELAEICEEKKSKIEDLKKKISSMEKIKKEKEDLLSHDVDQYRKYLGIDFKIVKDNILKIVFNKTCRDDNFECYIILDLSEGYNIIEIYPKVANIEKFNFMLRRDTSFFELLKIIRKEFVKEFCR